jgi:hypothetical protein
VGRKCPDIDTNGTIPAFLGFDAQIVLSDGWQDTIPFLPGLSG